MAEAFMTTFKHDYVRISVPADAESVLHQLPLWLGHHNELHLQRKLGYRLPRELIVRSIHEVLSSFLRSSKSCYVQQVMTSVQ